MGMKCAHNSVTLRILCSSLHSIATGTAFESAVLNLMSKGYERDMVVRALHASFNNPKIAADYLVNVSARKCEE